MFRFAPFVALLAVLLAAAGAQPQPAGDALARHRNLGKAFYENPTTQQKAVDEFKAALDLAPDSVRERVNYGLALLRAGRTADGVAELERAQKQDPSIPHTWFNLGIAYKKDSQYTKAIPQFEQMVKLVPDEPVSRYNLGYLYKVTDRPADALREFERAAVLDPTLAGPHFQLYNAYRDGGRDADAAREQQIFQDIKRRQAGAAVPEDLDWSVYAEILDPADPRDAADSTPPAKLAFTDRRLEGTFTGENAGVLAIDADGDGRADLLAWSSDGVRLLRNGDTLVRDAGLDGIKDVRSVAAGDFNNDGRPDLCIVTGTGAELYVNSGGRFAKAPVNLPAGSYAKAVWIDYDHDYDEDLLLVGADSRLMRNDGRAGFSDHTADMPFVSGRAVDAIVFDLMNNTIGHDVAVSYADRPGVIYRDLLGGKYRAIDLPGLPAGSRSLVGQDVDYDGWLDLMAAGPSGPVLLVGREGSFTAAPVTAPRASSVLAADFENRAVADLVSGGVVLRNQSQGRFAAPGTAVLANAVALAAADFDNDGRIDAAGIAADGSLHLLHNDTDTRNTFVRLTLQGVRNPRLAPQAQVEVKSGSHYQKQTYSGVPLVFGLRGSTSIDTIRVTWPNGLIQNELAQPVSTAGANHPVEIKEAQRLSGSCPMIFTWNGRAFQFITDVLGVAPLGASSGDGTYFPVDHDEYVQIPGSALTLTRGAYEIRITEELHEVSYLDQVQLIALDHPSGVQIFTNDKFKSPPFPEFRLFGATERKYPVKALDEGGRDVRRALMARDQVYPDRFARSYSGVAEPHVLDLDFGSAARDNRAVLILNGWVDWADGSTFLGASQEDPRGLMLPSLQVKDRSGKWVTVVEDMGILAGKPKTIAVDLTGKFLSASREVRIVTNLCVYWDEIFLIENSAAPKTVLTAVDASHVDLRFRGFSAVTIDPERTQPESFDYSRVSSQSMWNPTPGLYTRYGDVTPLLHAIDDRLVIMGSGDEIALTFPAAGLPALPRGWTRDFLLLVDGWAKDADPNTAFSQSVEPLPFH
ncbi:MAG TPA: FG-GAP-like repeat-containing protein, partial [Vicinamibacterales bacterium]|nr:FG-GAP-like repeat-containing protein [Vicinamibacterales bacterium]